MSFSIHKTNQKSKNKKFFLRNIKGLFNKRMIFTKDSLLLIY